MSISLSQSKLIPVTTKDEFKFEDQIPVKQKKTQWCCFKAKVKPHHERELTREEIIFTIHQRKNTASLTKPEQRLTDKDRIMIREALKA